jgi:hypothetical protein
MYERLKADGFECVQLTNRHNGSIGDVLLPYCGLDRINEPQVADGIVKKHVDRGDLCITVHAGWGLENDDEVFYLVDAILTASTRHRLPVFIETHRATITQDVWRTVQLTRRFPEITFNADFSHLYCGQELHYGDWATKIAFMEPIFARVGFLHGRIASSGCMQVPIDHDLTQRPKQAHGVADYLDHFKDLWTRAMLGFLRAAGPGNVLIFAPELLSGRNYYARFFPDTKGDLVEEMDRYAQALLLKELAKDCYTQAQRRMTIALGDQQSGLDKGHWKAGETI